MPLPYRKKPLNRRAKALRIAKIIFWGETIPQKIMHFYIYLIAIGAVLLYLPAALGLPAPPGEAPGYYKVVADDYFLPGTYSGLAARTITAAELKEAFADPTTFYYDVSPAGTPLADRVYVFVDGVSGVYKAVKLDHYTFWDAILASASAFSDTGITPFTPRDTYTGFGVAVLMVLVQVGGIGFVVICFLIWKLFMSRRKDHNAFSKSIILAAERGNSRASDAARTIVVSVSIIFAAELLFAVFYALYFAFVPAQEMMVLGHYGQTPSFSPSSRTVQNVSQLVVDNPDERIYVYHSPYAVWAGVVQSVSAMNNAGFDILGSGSLAPYRNDAHAFFLLMTMAESFIGCVGYPVLFEIHERIRIRRRKLNVKHRFSTFTKVTMITTAVVSAAGFAMVAGIEMPSRSGYFALPEALAASSGPGGTVRLTDAIPGLAGNADAIRTALYGHAGEFNAVWRLLFDSMSARGAGFSTTSGYMSSDATKGILCVLMFIGASPSSTGGGIRTTTFAVLWAAIWAKMRGHKQVRMFGRALPAATVADAFICFFLGIFILLVSSAVTLAILDAAVPGSQYRFIDVLYEFTSAFGTVGTSVGVSTTLTNIVEAPLFFVILLMVVGQLGISTSLLAWAGKNPKGNLYQYPFEDIRIG